MIGIFDSGSGGLTVLKEVRKLLPNADVVYFGDIANAPYGIKSQAELTKLTAQALSFLLERGVTTIVSACNSVASSVVMSLFDVFEFSPTHLIEMVGPTASHFRGDKESQLLLCATPATLQSGIYQEAFHMVGKEVVTVPIAELAGAIEFGRPKEEIEEVVSAALKEISSPYTHLILGCTHYPLVREIFQKIVGPEVEIVDPAVFVAKRVQKQCGESEKGSGRTSFFISKESPEFRAFVKGIVEDGSYTIEVI